MNKKIMLGILGIFLIGIVGAINIDIIISDRDLIFNTTIKTALASKGLSTINSTHTIDWDRETAQTCLTHPTDPNFNMPCLTEIETFILNCTVFEIVFSNETVFINPENESEGVINITINETTENCLVFDKINKTTEEIEIELKDQEDKKLEQIGIAFDQRSKDSNPQIISEGIITIN